VINNHTFLLALVMIATTTDAGTLACRVTGGSFKPAGAAPFEDAAVHEPSIVGRRFTVNRETGDIVGEGLFADLGRVVEVVANVEGSSDHFEAVLRQDDHGLLAGRPAATPHTDVGVLTIDRVDGQHYFKYYFSFLGLLLVGTCDGT
jgi:hypothetical protein